MIARCFDAAMINEIVNNPTVRPTCGGDITQPLDLTDALRNEKNLFFIGEYGGFIFMWSAPGVYEIHAMVLPEGRGSWAERRLSGLIATTKARLFWARIDPTHRHVRMLAYRCGFGPAGQDVLDIGAGPVVYDIFERVMGCHQQSLTA